MFYEEQREKKMAAIRKVKEKLKQQEEAKAIEEAVTESVNEQFKFMI